MFRAITFLLLVFTLSACRRCSCPTPPLHVAFVGFDSLDLKTLVLHKFKKNEGFQQAISFEVLDSNFTTGFTNDTASKPYCRIEYGFDWQIDLTNPPRSFRISDFQLDPAKDPPCRGLLGLERFCEKSILSVSVDNHPQSISNYYLYIHK